MKEPLALASQRDLRGRRHDWPPVVVQSGGAARIAVLSALVLVAAFLLWRRMTGELEAPLAGWKLILVTCALMLGGAASRWLDRSYCHPFSRLVAPAASIAILFAITLPTTVLWAACFAWSMLAVQSAVAVREAWRSERPKHQSYLFQWRVWLDNLTRIDSPHHVSNAPNDMTLPDTACVAVTTDRELVEPGVEEGPSRALSRGRDEHGRDFLSGWLRLDFQSGQRTEVAHVEFCPPFVTLPQAEAWCEEDTAVQVKIAQRWHHGMVLEIRLGHRPTEEERHRIAFHVAEPAKS